MKRHLVLITLITMFAATACVPEWMVPSDGGIDVPTSIDGTGATDVSAQMNAFFRSVPNGSVVDLQPGARYRMETTLTISKRSDLWIKGMGATFFMTTPGDRVRSNVRVIDSSNIMFTDIVVQGANPHAGLADEAQVLSKEGQQGFDVRSVDGFVLQRATITDTYGDFVYLGRNGTGRWSDGAVISDNTFARSGRHGVTMTAARNVLIENNSIDLIRFATFDLEAHHPGFGMENITIRNNTIGDGRGLLVASVGTGDRDNFTFEGNQVDRTLDIRMSSEDGARHSNWRIIGNTGATEAGNRMLAAMMFDHIDGLEVRDNYQAFEIARSMVGARVEDSCGVDISGNDFPGAVSEYVETRSC